MVASLFGVLIKPTRQWREISDSCPDSALKALVYTLILAVFPAVAWYWGATQVGWRVGDGDIIKLTASSANSIIPLFYLAMVGGITFIGYMVHWMSATYGAESSIGKGIAITGYAATPLFVVGIIGLYPLFWVALLLGMLAVSYSVYLLYLGIPIVMKIPEERGFLFASAVVAVCLVIAMTIMGGMVILWDMGFAPVFTD